VLEVVVIANLILWVVARPGGQPGPRYFGELLGAGAVLLFTCSLILATLLRVIERAFGGLDRVARWHRHTAVAAVVLIIAHAAFAGSTPAPDVAQVGLAFGSLAMLGPVVLSVWAQVPSLKAARWSKIVQRLAALSYERWLTGHRLTGLFVAAAVVHAVMVDPVVSKSAILKVTYLVVGVPGVAAYRHRERLARFGPPIYDYIVAVVSRGNDSTIDAFVEPAGPSLAFEPGQFIFLAFDGTNGWQCHPYTTTFNQATEPWLRGRSEASSTAAAAMHRSGSRAVWPSPRSSAESAPCPTTFTTRCPSPARSATHPQPSSSMRSSGPGSRPDPATAPCRLQQGWLSHCRHRGRRPAGPPATRSASAAPRVDDCNGQRIRKPGHPRANRSGGNDSTSADNH
jgi:hypothetical protein